MPFRELIARRPVALSMSLVLLVTSYVLINVLSGGMASSRGWPLGLVQSLSYPGSLIVGVALAALAILFVLWAARDRSTGTWLPAAVAVALAAPLVMVLQDLAIPLLIPGATPPVWIDAFSGLLNGVLTAGVGAVVAVFAARVMGVPAQRTSAST